VQPRPAHSLYWQHTAARLISTHLSDNAMKEHCLARKKFLVTVQPHFKLHKLCYSVGCLCSKYGYLVNIMIHVSMLLLPCRLGLPWLYI
jgi:hypothetical protein